MSNHGQGNGDISSIRARAAHPSAVRAAVERVSIGADHLNIAELHDLVTRHNGRVELDACNGTTCVLISKSELDAIEQALALLSDGQAVQEMRHELAKVAAAASLRPAGAVL